MTAKGILADITQEEETESKDSKSSN